MHLEWQVHPAKDGLLRYTLVQKYRKLGSRICAIDHHMGWELSLSVEYSEGVLLLPELHGNEDFEEFVVASLLGILVQLRMLSKRNSGTSNLGKV
jgi:hypothetical protein